MISILKRRISEGENQQQDFKFSITDSRKIARSLVAFANTDGGRLLVGVKDNGAIAGVRSEEEYYMIEAASSVYCKPEITFETKRWEIEGKIVLEIIIPQSVSVPVLAQDQDGNWDAYIRVKDQNILANSVLLKVWKLKRDKTAINITITEKEKKLIDYLKQNQNITLTSFYKLAHISQNIAEETLAKFVILKIIKMNCFEKETFYSLIK